MPTPAEVDADPTKATRPARPTLHLVKRASAGPADPPKAEAPARIIVRRRRAAVAADGPHSSSPSGETQAPKAARTFRVPGDVKPPSGAAPGTTEVGASPPPRPRQRRRDDPARRPGEVVRLVVAPEARPARTADAGHEDGLPSGAPGQGAFPDRLEARQLLEALDRVGVVLGEIDVLRRTRFAP
jgi:hypothetical protein